MSLAQTVREHWPLDRRIAAIEALASIADGNHDDHRARIVAFSELCRRGWPLEHHLGFDNLGEAGVGGSVRKVIFELHDHAPGVSAPAEKTEMLVPSRGDADEP